MKDAIKRSEAAMAEAEKTGMKVVQPHQIGTIISGLPFRISAIAPVGFMLGGCIFPKLSEKMP